MSTGDSASDPTSEPADEAAEPGLSPDQPRRHVWRKSAWLQNLRGIVALGIVAVVLISMAHKAPRRPPDLRPLLVSAPEGMLACPYDPLVDLQHQSRDMFSGPLDGPGLLSFSAGCWMTPPPQNVTEVILFAFDRPADAMHAWTVALPQYAAKATKSAPLAGAAHVETFTDSDVDAEDGIEIQVVGLRGDTIFLILAPLSQQQTAADVDRIALKQYALLVARVDALYSHGNWLVNTMQ